MNIFTIVNKPISSNCFVISQNTNCIIIDPGTKYFVALEQFLGEYDLNPSYIILTHEHYDHIEGCNFLRLRYPNVKLITSNSCSLNIQDDRWNLSRFKADDGVGFIVDAADIVINKDERLNLLGIDFCFLLTPGHSLGSMCFWCEDYFFSGDMLIPGEKIILKLKGGSKEDYVKSLQRMKQVLYSRCFTILPGHKACFKICNETVL